MNDSRTIDIPVREILIPCLRKYKVLVSIGALLIISFSTFIALLWVSHLTHSEIFRNGEKAIGKIFDKKSDRDSTGYTEYRLVYSFAAKINGRKELFETFGEEDVDKEEWDSTKLNDPIEIAYDENDPHKNVAIEDGGINSRFIVVIFTVLLGFFVGLGVLILYGFVFNLVLFTSKLLNSGIQTTGKITKIENQAGNIIHYEFKDKTGDLHQGVSGIVSDEIAAKWSVGQTGAVCYDPLKPKKNLWYGEDWKKYLL